jgi:predicted transposase/invertase (TIGR01784 family)
MKKIIRPTIDCVFKAILGSNENKPLLINFLNAILGLEKGQAIKDVVILNPYNEKEFQDDKLSIIDIKATDETGAFHQIDVQISIYRWLAERMLFNWASIYHAQLTSGQDYTQLKPTTSIWLLEDALFSPETEEEAAFIQEKQKMQAAADQKDSEIQKLKTLLRNALKISSPF